VCGISVRLTSCSLCQVGFFTSRDVALKSEEWIPARESRRSDEGRRFRVTGSSAPEDSSLSISPIGKMLDDD
jgi:hypothetical protein